VADGDHHEDDCWRRRREEVMAPFVINVDGLWAAACLAKRYLRRSIRSASIYYDWRKEEERYGQ
jgi:hypothetical protein